MNHVCVMEVGPRDGFQSIEPFIPTDIKIKLIKNLGNCGFSRMELGSFVSPARLPQMADAREILAAVGERLANGGAVLVPNVKGAQFASAAGARGLVTVISATESHNQANIGRSIEGSMNELGQILRTAPRDIFIRLNIATSFHCPFEGPVSARSVAAIVGPAVEARPGIEIGLCDTIGKAMPTEVSALFGGCMREFPNCTWAFHGHDTYGFGVANVLAAYEAGVRVIDSAAGGLGGCPFAPGASGNVATEDVVYTFERLGISTGIDFESLLSVADQMTKVPGAVMGGHIRDVMLRVPKISTRAIQ